MQDHMSMQLWRMIQPRLLGCHRGVPSDRQHKTAVGRTAEDKPRRSSRDKSPQSGTQRVRPSTGFSMERQQRVRVLNRWTQHADLKWIAFDAGENMDAFASLPKHPKGREGVAPPCSSLNRVQNSAQSSEGKSAEPQVEAPSRQGGTHLNLHALAAPHTGVSPPASGRSSREKIQCRTTTGPE